MSYKFKKSSRLLKRNNFKHIVALNQKQSGSFIHIYYRGYSSVIPKIGITVSSRFGNAIERNLFKRQIREIFRKNNENIPSLEMIVYPKKTAKIASYHQLQKEFLYLLKKTKSHI